MLPSSQSLPHTPNPTILSFIMKESPVQDFYINRITQHMLLCFWLLFSACCFFWGKKSFIYWKRFRFTEKLWRWCSELLYTSHLVPQIINISYYFIFCYNQWNSINTLLLTGANSLFKCLLCLTNILCLFQDPIQDTIYHLVIMCF